MDLRSAVSHVNKKQVLLVFPVNNQKEPASLWSQYFPRTKMRWEWDESGDQHVSDLWHLRERLSTSGKVVYSKWFRGRATLISHAIFPAMLRSLNPNFPEIDGLSFTARELLDILDEDSPVSTKKLKTLADLRGRENESRYNRALKELWSRNLIVVNGEVDEGAFPSIAIGSTRLIFEDLWLDAGKLEFDEAKSIVLSKLDPASPFLKFYKQLLVSQARG